MSEQTAKKTEEAKKLEFSIEEKTAYINPYFRVVFRDRWPEGDSRKGVRMEMRIELSDTEIDWRTVPGTVKSNLRTSEAMRRLREWVEEDTWRDAVHDALKHRAGSPYRLADLKCALNNFGIRKLRGMDVRA